MQKRMLFKVVIPAILLCCGLGYFLANDSHSSPIEKRTAGFEQDFPVHLGDNALNLRLAITDLERSQGLTGCRGLPKKSGMLFIYADSAARGFWMRGVPIGLSIGFLDASGVLLETHEMNAEDLNITRSRSDAVKFVLEMSTGWFDANGITPGTRLSLEDIADAMTARGFLPENYNLRVE